MKRKRRRRECFVMLWIVGKRFNFVIQLYGELVIESLIIIKWCKLGCTYRLNASDISISDLKLLTLKPE